MAHMTTEQRKAMFADKKRLLSFLKRKPNSTDDNFSESLEFSENERGRLLIKLEKEGLITKDDKGKHEEFPVFNITKKGEKV